MPGSLDGVQLYRLQAQDNMWIKTRTRHTQINGLTAADYKVNASKKPHMKCKEKGIKCEVFR